MLKAADSRTDWDMYVLAPNGSGGLKQLTAATGSASESLEIPNPVAGTYYIIVDSGFAGGSESEGAFTLTVTNP